MSKISNEDFKSLLDVLPARRFLRNKQIRDRCEVILYEFAMGALAKAFVPNFGDVKSFCRKVSSHARSLHKLLDLNSVETFRLLYSVEMIPDHAGRVQLRRVARRLPGLVNRLDWIATLCERPQAASKQPLLWKFVKGRRGAPPMSAIQRLVEELCDLFEEMTHQPPTRGNGPFMDFALAFTALFSRSDRAGADDIKYRVTEDMIDHQLRIIIRRRKAKPNPPAAEVFDSRRSRIARRIRPAKNNAKRSEGSG